MRLMVISFLYDDFVFVVVVQRLFVFKILTRNQINGQYYRTGIKGILVTIIISNV